MLGIYLMVATGFVVTTQSMKIAPDNADHILSHVTVAAAKIIETAGDQLLFITDKGLQLASLQSSSSVPLFYGSFTDVAQEPTHGQIVTLVEYRNKSQAIVFWDTNDFLNPRGLKLTPDPCWNGKKFENESNRARRISFDWIWRNVYILTSCGSIHVCGIDSLHCNFFLNVDHRKLRQTMLVHPRLGLMFYIEVLPGRIHRANLDGRSLSLIVQRDDYILGGALDYENSRLYWNDVSCQCLVSCDMDGNVEVFQNAFAAHAKLSFRVVAIHREQLYSTRTSSVDYHPQRGEISFLDFFTASRPDIFASVHRENLTDGQKVSRNFSQIFPKKDTRQALILNARQQDRSSGHPCSHITCTQVCVPSGNSSRPKCLQEEVKLLVTTTNAVLIYNSNGSSGWNNVAMIRNLANPRGITHDFRRGYIFWTEELDDVTVIRRHSLRDRTTTSVLIHEKLRLTLTEELQAMAYDWIAGNIYLVFRNTMRIYVCNVTSGAAQTCAEVLSNTVATDVGGLALDPDYGRMYWTQKDSRNPSIVRARMDGSDYKVLRAKGMDSPGGVAIDFKTNRVLWVDSMEKYIGSMDYSGENYREFEIIHQRYIPQHLGVHENGLYLTGIQGSYLDTPGIFFKNRKDDEKLVLNVSMPTSFTIYSSLSQPNYGVENACENHSCPGICLVSDYDSFRCACPIGTRSENNGSTCAGVEDPRVIFATARGGVVVQNKWDGDGHSVDAGNTLVHSIAHSVDRQLVWLAGDGNILELKDVTFNNTGKRFSLVGGKIQSRTLSYDWIGNNLFYFSVKQHLVICSCASGECIDRGKLSGHWMGTQFALDPNMGLLYWCSDGTIRRVEMDGSTGLRDVILGCKDGAIAVDPETHSILWFNKDHWIASCDPRGNNMRLLATVGLASNPQKLTVRGSSIFSMTYLDRTTMYSCGKYDCDGLRGHKLSNYFVKDVYVDHPGSQPTKRKNPCIGSLCSHICVATSTDYMRCLCPAELQLSSDGWNCECRPGRRCDRDKQERKQQMSLSPTSPAVVDVGRDCSAGDAFRCSNSTQCVNISRICDGRGDCADLSDEGPRCAEPCSQVHECSYECIPTPKGPKCACPSEQTLNEDQKNCVYLKIEKIPTTSFPVALLAVALIAGALLILSTVALVKYQRARKRLRNLTPEEVDEFLRGNPPASDVAPDGGEKALALPFTHTLAPDSLIVARETAIGSGEFGVVHAGLWNNSVPVAVKTFKRTLDVDEFKAVLAEVKIMAYLGDHEHVVKFLGSDVSEITSRKIRVVTELSPHGDLLRYLWKLAPRSQIVQVQTDNASYSVCQKEVGAPTAEIATSDLVNWCEQIADGMEYLTMKKIIHGDLAARNVLVFSNNVLKISDFGMSKKLYTCGQYKSKKQPKLPWRWASIELLTNGEFSEASDVWSFGVTAWEIFTFGRTPYSGMRYGQQFIQYLEQGNRLANPQGATDAMYAVLLQCWDVKTSSRPTFALLKAIFREKATVALQKSQNMTDSSYVEAI